MHAAGFRLWDAPGFGSPWLAGVSSQWADRVLHTVTLARCRSEPRDDLPDISVSTTKPGWSAAPHQGLTVGALLGFAIRLATAGPMSARAASWALVELSHAPGLPATLTVDGIAVDARRYDVPATGDWVVTSADPLSPVCVAGRAGLSVPALEVADMALWSAPLADQIAEVAGRG